MNKALIIAIAMCGCLASCSTVVKTGKTYNLTSGVMATPTVADVDVKPQKVQKTVEWEYSPLDRLSLKERKANLMADILAEHGGDVLLEPQSTLVSSFWGKRTLTMTGYSAKLTNFRKASNEDVKMLGAGLPDQVCPVYDVTSPMRADSPEDRVATTKTRKKTHWTVWAGINVAGLDIDVDGADSPDEEVKFNIGLEYSDKLFKNVDWSLGAGLVTKGCKGINLSYAQIDAQLAWTIWKINKDLSLGIVGGPYASVLVKDSKHITSEEDLTYGAQIGYRLKYKSFYLKIMGGSDLSDLSSDIDIKNTGVSFRLGYNL